MGMLKTFFKRKIFIFAARCGERGENTDENDDTRRVVCVYLKL